MANQRALVIVGGVQQRIPWDQANGADKLDIGAGIVGFAKGDSTDLTPLASIELAHADQRLDVLGNAHFKKDIKIDGELTVVGTASVTDTFIAQTIFQESVKFGEGTNAKTGDKAIFDASIQMDTEQASWLKTTGDGNSLTFEAAADAVTISALKNSKFEVTGGSKMLQLLANGAGSLI